MLRPNEGIVARRVYGIADLPTSHWWGDSRMAPSIGEAMLPATTPMIFESDAWSGRATLQTGQFAAANLS